MGSVWSTLVMMFLLTLTSFLALSQAQQSGSDSCLDPVTGDMTFFTRSPLHQKALDAYQQCSPVINATLFGSSQRKRGVEERQTSDDQCPPVSEMGIAVNDPNPMHFWDSMIDCVLGAMDFIAPEGYPRNRRIMKAIDSINIPEVVEVFSRGDTTRQGWNNCRNEKYGYRNEMAERATSCGEAYTEDEAKAMKFYGARYDAFKCLTWELSEACQWAYLTTAHNCETTELRQALLAISF